MVSGTKGNPFFSVCIPAFRCGEVLNEALASVARQSFDDWEVIVINDGSGEETSSLCRKQSIIDADRYTFIDAQHGGQLASRMRMLTMARGDYVLSLDADDAFIGRDSFRVIYDAIKATNCDVLLFNATRNLATKKPFVDYSSLSLHQTLFSGVSRVDVVDVERSLMDSFTLNNVWCKAYTNKCLTADRSDVPVIHMNEDRLQSLWIIESAKTYALVDEPLYYYRPNPSSITERPFLPSYFDDMLEVEARVDVLRAAKGRMGEERDALLLFQLLMPALVAVAKSSGDEKKRLDAYSRIYDRVMTSKDFPHGVIRSRLDKTIALMIFFERRFRELDGYLRLRQVFKDPIGRLFEKKRVR